MESRGHSANERLRLFIDSTGPPAGESVARAGIIERGQLVIEVQKLTSEIELVEYEIVDMMIRDHGFDPRTHNIDIHELSDIKNLKGYHNA